MLTQRPHALPMILRLLYNLPERKVKGFIDEIRISKGKARWKAKFVKPWLIHLSTPIAGLVFSIPLERRK